MNPSSRRLIQYVGSVKLEIFSNPQLRPTIQAFCEQQEQEDSSVKKAQIKGIHLHKSHDDPNDTKPVISVRFIDKDDRRLGTGHVHDDGTGSVNWK
ncbi:hypothetical protein HRR77_000717 [Exophiala dermatitidis]|nr:hypothetical protein HRR74_000719 [Exophiala dermatitidis]KAJ4558733.1 hypothetical protein HRR77_000717 [Exophiala dermatitidis]